MCQRTGICKERDSDILRLAQLAVTEIKRRKGFEILFDEIERHVPLLSNTVSLFRLFDSRNMARGIDKSIKTLTD